MQITPEGTMTLTSGTTASVPSGTGIVVVNPNSSLLTMNITLPTSPSDRDVLVLEFGGVISSGSTVVVALGFTSAMPILGILPTSASSGTCMAFIYNVKIGKWYRFI